MSINRERLLADIHNLGQIGYQEGVGTTRLAYSEAFQKGQELVVHLMEEAGLTVKRDAVGNVTGRLAGKTEKIIALGSHIDTVPGGGMYDGAYGVLAAIECARVLREEGVKNHHTIEVIAFTEEEGNVVGGTFGSKCFTGAAIDKAMEGPMKACGITAGMVRAAARNPQDYACYLELHIEQGGILESCGAHIGVAEGIVGILRYKAQVVGEENHAGSTPMCLRKDALRTSCQVILRLMEKAERHSSMTATVGTLSLAPGAVNVIPGFVEFIVELRYRSMAQMEQIAGELLDEFADQGLSLTEYIRQKETACDQALMAEIRQSCRTLGCTFREMFSGAGHDLINMAPFTPSALLFIPSQGGISHSPREYSTGESVGMGAMVLYETLLRLDRKGVQEKQ